MCGTGEGWGSRSHLGTQEGSVFPQDHGGLSTAILMVFLESACNLPVSGVWDPGRPPSTQLFHAFLCLTCSFPVLQRNPFDYLNGEYRAKKLSRFTKVSACVCACVCEGGLGQGVEEGEDGR